MTPTTPRRDSKAAKPRKRSRPRSASAPDSERCDDGVRDSDERALEDHIQEGHSVLWSACAGMTEYEARRFATRYLPIGDEQIAKYLVENWDRVAKEDDSDSQPPIEKGLVKLGLWYFQPQFDRFKDKAHALREAFSKSFCVDPAAFPTDGPGRPAVPAFPALGLQQATLTTTKFRRTTRVRLECTVLRSYQNMRDMVYPWNWTGCPFWKNLPDTPADVPEFWSDEKMRVAVQLPGGRWATESVELPGGGWTTRAKQRNVELYLEAVRSPFQTRLDYEGHEPEDDNLSVEAGGAGIGASDSDATREQRPLLDGDDRPDVLSSRRNVEVEQFFGYMLVEKHAGQPGACRIVFERQGSFGHPNHNYFCEETLGYWVTSELITFVEGALRRTNARKEGEVAP